MLRKWHAAFLQMISSAQNHVNHCWNVVIHAQALAPGVLEVGCTSHALILVTATCHVAMCAGFPVPMPALLVSKVAEIIAITASAHESVKSLVLPVWNSANGSVSTTSATRNVENCVTALAVISHAERSSSAVTDALASVERSVQACVEFATRIKSTNC